MFLYSPYSSKTLWAIKSDNKRGASGGKHASLMSLWLYWSQHLFPAPFEKFFLVTSRDYNTTLGNNITIYALNINLRSLLLVKYACNLGTSKTVNGIKIRK